MDRDHVLSLYDQQLRIQLDDPDAAREVLPRVVRLVRPAPPMGFIRYSDLDETSAEAEIRMQIDHFDRRGMAFEWEVFGHDRPASLKALLRAHGFTPSLPEDDPGAVLVLDLDEAPPRLLAPVRADVRPLDRESLHHVARIEAAVYGRDFSWLEGRLATHLAIPGYLSVFAAHVGGTPVAAAWTYFYPNSQFAILRGGATLPPYRRQGLYVALLAARAQQALARGTRYLIVDAGPESRRILEQHGFALLTTAEPFLWEPTATS